MSFQWSDLHPIAEQLYEIGKANKDEASLRSAINRAYYAAFGAAAEFACLRDQDKKSENSHQKVIEAFRNYGTTDERSNVAFYLNKMRLTRKWADYDSNSSESNIIYQADDVVNEAQLVIEIIRRAQNES